MIFDQVNAIKNAYDIRCVALYLRKSRGEEDKDLEKHRFILLEMCRKNNWKYVEYVEIANSESIEYRPKFKQLLSDVTDGLYDAVLVVDYQRLGRGEIEDQGIIKRVFRDSETYIVTPEKIYNLVDDTDDLLVDVRGLLARQEYKSITKNLQRGKKIGARLGKWTNGPAPYPYKYVAAIKGLEINPAKLPYYLEAKERVLAGERILNIEWDFNNRGIPGPKGGLWHENSIRRMLVDETHLGRIISNKSRGSGHKKKKTKPLQYIPRNEWYVVENCHESVKTSEEHERLIQKININRDLPRRARSGAYSLSGLVYCGKCKKMIRYDVRRDSQGNKYAASFKACNKYDHFGNYCSNRGLPVNLLLDVLNDRLSKYEAEIFQNQATNSKKKEIRLMAQLEEKERLLDKLKKSLLKIKEMFEMEDYTREEYEERRDKRNREIRSVEEDIMNIRVELNIDQLKSNAERLAKIHSFREMFSSPTASEEDKNRVAKDVISHIDYVHHQDGSIDIDVEFR